MLIILTLNFFKNHVAKKSKKSKRTDKIAGVYEVVKKKKKKVL